MWFGFDMNLYISVIFTYRWCLLFAETALSFGSEQEGHIVLFICRLSLFFENRIVFPYVGLSCDIGFGHYSRIRTCFFLLILISIYRKNVFGFVLQDKKLKLKIIVIGFWLICYFVDKIL